MRKVNLTLMIIIIIVSGTSTVLMAMGEPETENYYISQINRWKLIKYNQEHNAGIFKSNKEGYNEQIKELDPLLQDATEEYNTIDKRRITATGELNSAYSELMYANNMLDSFSDRSPSQIPPGAVDYWRNKRKKALDRYNNYSAEIPMIEAELESAKEKLDDLKEKMNDLISARDGAESAESYHNSKVVEAQEMIDHYQGLLDGLLQEPNED
ncbi:hypothetical protein C6497_17055 [Candidatus Poribacteria bacterium]|nr:MAG: hypothetical protein C6497_17055 [Candidatus Poribacteria bacterium]